MKDIYEYLDYRQYLQDYFNDQKKKNKVFSHQFFARKAGIKSSGFILHVMKHERNLTKAVALKVARSIGLNEKETLYFENLISYNQAKNINDKNIYFKRIMESRKFFSVKKVEDNQYEFYSSWYHSVIRELITFADSNSDAKRLSKALVPEITTIQLKKSLKLLERLNLIKRNKDGLYVQTDQFLVGGGATRTDSIVNFQKEMLQNGLEAWNRFKEKEISMNTMTLCMSEELMPEVVKIIQNCKESIMSLVKAEQKPPERVYQININLFPVSKVQKG